MQRNFMYSLVLALLVLVHQINFLKIAKPSELRELTSTSFYYGVQKFGRYDDLSYAMVTQLSNLKIVAAGYI